MTADQTFLAALVQALGLNREAYDCLLLGHEPEGRKRLAESTQVLFKALELYSHKETKP